MASSRSTFGPYVIHEELGVGGMATVHRAELPGIEGFSKQVALKRMLPALADSEEGLSSFLREAQLASYLHHANVALTYELGQINGTYFIAMELIHGQSLYAIMNRCAAMASPMPVAVACSLITQILDALDYAHNLADHSGQPLGIIHRDVSPSNVIVAADSGIAKLIDFGIAKASAAGMQTMNLTLKGKWAYMAPEYVELGQIDSRADLFAVGVIAHELLVCRPLFSAADDVTTLTRLRTMEIPAPSRANPSVPHELDQVVLAALARNPNQRWQTAAAMRHALAAVVKHMSFEVPPSYVAQWMADLFGTSSQFDDGAATMASAMAYEDPDDPPPPNDSGAMRPQSYNPAVLDLSGTGPMDAYSPPAADLQSTTPMRAYNPPAADLSSTSPMTAFNPSDEDLLQLAPSPTGTPARGPTNPAMSRPPGRIPTPATGSAVVPSRSPTPAAASPMVPSRSPTPAAASPVVPSRTATPAAASPVVPSRSPTPASASPMVPLRSPTPASASPMVPSRTATPPAASAVVPPRTARPSAAPLDLDAPPPDGNVPLDFDPPMPGGVPRDFDPPMPGGVPRPAMAPPPNEFSEPEVSADSRPLSQMMTSETTMGLAYQDPQPASAPPPVESALPTPPPNTLQRKAPRAATGAEPLWDFGGLKVETLRPRADAPATAPVVVTVHDKKKDRKPREPISDDTKRILIIAAAVLVTLGLAAAGYFLFA